MNEIIFAVFNSFSLTVLIRVLLAGFLGGIIGYERESMNRPAGFRTHILVCVGSALVMCTSQFIFEEYNEFANVDPARLGAQVISGIGFLGAGTIIRDGVSVRGLTTAASLWAVSCVGISAGIGFYQGAIITTVIIYITLIVLKEMESLFTKKKRLSILNITTKNTPGQIGTIGHVFGKYNIEIKNIEFINNDHDDYVIVKFLVKIPNNVKKEAVIGDIQEIKGVKEVHEE